MSVLSVVYDVCLAVGVNPPTTLFGSSVQPRTQAEMLSLANETAQRIAYDYREWTVLKLICTFKGDGLLDRFPLPANYQRMLLNAQVNPEWAPRQPLRFVADTNEWLIRRLNNESDTRYEWTLMGNDMLIYPIMVDGQGVLFPYLDKNCVKLFDGSGNNSSFTNDGDEFRIPERLLKLAMIWQWKANKGSPYAEDMSTFYDALSMTSGADQPAPIIVDRMPLSTSAQGSYPWPVPS